MCYELPMPGDLIDVVDSEWYALKAGGQLRVCEQPGWAVEGRDIYVVPRQQSMTFWGPTYGPPDGMKPEKMSTSGGPFKTITVVMVPKLELIEATQDWFWHWQDWPRAGGGVDYLREVARWRLSVLPDDCWLDPGRTGSNRVRNGESGPIRLACQFCDRDDCNGIGAMPDGWTEIAFVQSLARSRQAVEASELHRSPMEWFTHLGVCPECQLAERENESEELTP